MHHTQRATDKSRRNGRLSITLSFEQRSNGQRDNKREKVTNIFVKVILSRLTSEVFEVTHTTQRQSLVLTVHPKPSQVRGLVSGHLAPPRQHVAHYCHGGGDEDARDCSFVQPASFPTHRLFSRQRLLWNTHTNTNVLFKCTI